MLASRKVVPGRPSLGSLRFCNPGKWGLGLSWPWAQGSLCVQVMAISMLTGESGQQVPIQLLPWGSSFPHVVVEITHELFQTQPSCAFDIWVSGEEGFVVVWVSAFR